MAPTVDFLLVKTSNPLVRMRSLSAAAPRPPARRGGLAAAALGAVLNVFRFMIAYSQIRPIGCQHAQRLGTIKRIGLHFLR